MQPLFSRPRRISSDSLLLVGYRLFPLTSVTLHPRLTVIAGGNGVGKTTLLDALQIILIADQRLLRLNVASGQDDRDIGGQMMGSVAWLVLSIQGHSSIDAMGVHLERKVSREQVEISPFILRGIRPEKDLFLDRNSGEVTQDLTSLGRRVTLKSLTASLKPFDSVSEYHNHLFDEGLLSMDLGRENRRRFAHLWKHATHPHSGELSGFLQSLLCHQPSRRVSLQDVEGLMQQRIRVESTLGQLTKIRELNALLTGLAGEMDAHRRAFLSGDLWERRESEENTARAAEKERTALQSIKERAAATAEEILKRQDHVTELGRKRDQYLKDQGDLDRKLRHFRTYQEKQRLIQETLASLVEPKKDSERLEERLRELTAEGEKLQEESARLLEEQAGLKAAEPSLREKATKWNELQIALGRAGQEAGCALATHADVQSKMKVVSEERLQLANLASLRIELAQCRARARAHDEAVQLHGRMVALWCEAFEGKPPLEADLIGALDELEARKAELAVMLKASDAEALQLQELISELSRRGIDLPAVAGKLVAEELAKPLSAQYEDLDEAEAKCVQERIGPFLRAVQPDSLEDLTPLARGDEPYLLMLADDGGLMKTIVQSEEGTIAGSGALAWYTPHGPALLGAKAREARIEDAQQRLSRITTAIETARKEMGTLSLRSRSIRDFLPKLHAFSDRDAQREAAEIAERVMDLEARKPRIERLYRLLDEIVGMKDRFGYTRASAELEKLQESMKRVTERLDALTEARIRNTEARKETAIGLENLKDKISRAELVIETSRVVCEELEAEEPEEVLQGRVDFGRAEELKQRIDEMDAELSKERSTLSRLERRKGREENEIEHKRESLFRLERALETVRSEHTIARSRWVEIYPDEEVQYRSGAGDLGQFRMLWSKREDDLKQRLRETADLHGLSFEDQRPERDALSFLERVLPGVDLDELEKQCVKLGRELQQVEQKIRSRVEDFRSHIESEIRHLNGHLTRANQILSTLSFGRIGRIVLDLERLPCYHALRALQSEQLNLFAPGSTIGLREFVKQIRDYIYKESKVELTEESLTDYRSYVRIVRKVYDEEGSYREGGFSTGENLGLNLALCLTILYLFRIQENGKVAAPGMLLLAMDEAERLDAKALETVSLLLDKVGCQLVIASPRPVKVAESICHICSPLPQGVTSVALYCTGAAESVA